MTPDMNFYRVGTVPNIKAPAASRDHIHALIAQAGRLIAKPPQALASSPH